MPRENHQKTAWGPWSYEPETFHLVGRFPRDRTNPEEYGVRLDSCRDSAGVLDWIIQFARKSWTTPEQVGHLVSALDDLLGLQQNICGNEQNKRIAPRSVIAKRLEQKTRHRKSRGQSAS